MAQELFRRAAVDGKPDPERIPCWQGGEHELAPQHSKARPLH